MRVRLMIGMLTLLPAVALAQHKTGTSGRVAAIASPPEPAPSPVTVPPPGQYLYGSMPVLITPDGRVFADFGRGYEQLVRNCATPYANYQTAPTAQPSPVAQPTAVQPSPLPYTQPVPNQQTASQQMASQQQMANLPRATTMNAQSCWSTDSRGRVMVGR